MTGTSYLVFFRTLFGVTALSVVVLVVSGASWPGYLAVGLVDGDEEPDSTRVALQYTAVVGAHNHGINW